MSIKCSGDKKEKPYMPHMLRSRPLRCISLPLCCLLLFIFYWFVVCPLVYVGIRNKCKTTKCNLYAHWPWYFWIIALGIFIILLSIILCIWCCKPNKKPSKETEERQKEYQTLLKESFDYDSTKRKREGVEKVNERELPEKLIKKFEIKQRQVSGLNQINEEKETEIKKDKDTENIQTKPNIDAMFPRCSVRRKDVGIIPSLKKRPETLAIQSPKFPKDQSSAHRHSLIEQVAPISPLSPREIFFYDLFRNAHLQTLDKTRKFIDNERKHSSNNTDDSGQSKPEIKDFVLKQKLSSKGSTPGTPEFFIANVSPDKKCSSEVFMYVEGGQPKETLTLCYLDKDDVCTP